MFPADEMLEKVAHLSVAGRNVSDRAEVTTEGVGSFGTIAVDDIAQAKIGHGTPIQAVKNRFFSRESAVELGTIATGKSKPEGRAPFKWGICGSRGCNRRQHDLR